MARQYQRRLPFLPGKLQNKLALGYILFVAGGCLFFISLFSALSPEQSSMNDAQGLHLGAAQLTMFKQLLASHWLFAVVGAVFLFIIASLVSHRVTGPLYRFEKTLESMLQRSLKIEVQLRKKDEGQELAAKINSFNEQLAADLKTLRLASQGLDELVEQAKLRSKTEIPERYEELAGIYWGMQSKIKKIKSVCSSYQLPGD